MARKLTLLAAFLAVLSFSSAASARTRDAAQKLGGSIELVLGEALPQGDDNYEDLVDNSLKLGGRGVIYLAGVSETLLLGLELGLDYSDADLKDNFLLDTLDAYRLRFLAGARLSALLTPKVALFARGGIGIDQVEVSSHEIDWAADDTGLALEIGGGIVARMDKLAIGGQLAVPMGFHNDDDTSDGWDSDYDSTELDLLFTVGGWW